MFPPTVAEVSHQWSRRARRRRLAGSAAEACIRVRCSHDAIEATVPLGSVSSTTCDQHGSGLADPRARNRTVSESHAAASTGARATDLAVAQAVVDERENLARDRDACLVGTAPLGQLAIVGSENGAAMGAADPFDQRPPQQPRSLFGDPTAPRLGIGFVMRRRESPPGTQMRRGREAVTSPISATKIAAIVGPTPLIACTAR